MTFQNQLRIWLRAADDLYLLVVGLHLATQDMCSPAEAHRPPPAASPWLLWTLPNLIGFTWKLISLALVLPLSSTRPPPLQSEVQRMTQCTLVLLFVSVGVNSPPRHARELVLSRIAEYPGPLPSPQISQYGLFLSLRLSLPLSAFSNVPLTSLSALNRWELSARDIHPKIGF